MFSNSRHSFQSSHCFDWSGWHGHLNIDWDIDLVARYKYLGELGGSTRLQCHPPSAPTRFPVCLHCPVLKGTKKPLKYMKIYNLNIYISTVCIWVSTIPFWLWHTKQTKQEATRCPQLFYPCYADLLFMSATAQCERAPSLSHHCGLRRFLHSVHLSRTIALYMRTKGGRHCRGAGTVGFNVADLQGLLKDLKSHMLSRYIL